MGKAAKKSLELVGLDTDVPTPKKSADEKNLERQQQDELKSQEAEIRRRRSLLGKGGRRSLISGGETGFGT